MHVVVFLVPAFHRLFVRRQCHSWGSPSSLASLFVVSAGARPRPNGKTRGRRVSLFMLSLVFLLFVQFFLILNQNSNHRSCRSHGRVRGFCVISLLSAVDHVATCPNRLPTTGCCGDSSKFEVVWQPRRFHASVSGECGVFPSCLISRWPSHLNHSSLFFKTLERVLGFILVKEVWCVIQLIYSIYSCHAV